jgi:hypothetical protein
MTVLAAIKFACPVWSPRKATPDVIRERIWAELADWGGTKTDDEIEADIKHLLEGANVVARNYGLKVG